MLRTSLLSFVFLIVTVCGVSSPAFADKPADVSFRNAGVTLAGEIRLPSKTQCDKCPALVIVHGSGTSSRSNPWTAAWVDALVKHGVAVLYPDKRGSGASGGRWQEASFRTLAGDTLAAVKTLKDNPRVDPERLGVIGFSQGGDIVPLAASLSDDVKLVVDVSGSVVPLQEEIFDEIRQDAQKTGLSPTQISQLHRLHKQVMAIAHGHGDWAAYQQQIEAAKAMGIGGEFINNLPQDKSLWVWHWLDLNADFSPLPYWQKLCQPSLMIYGGRDNNVDTRKNLAVINSRLLPAKDNLSLIFLNPNGHALFRPDVTAFVAQWMYDGGAK